ncbi:MAG TPA: GNAT family N-acetyltransferase [Ardenticatenaceae bacterium]|nr:GNAT family N-acetyltransferase [Ardenticatenaceae bacterium]
MVTRVRFATHDDIPAIQQIARHTWARTYAGLIPEPVQQDFLDSAYSREALARRLGSPLLRTWVAEQNERVVGYLILYLPDEPASRPPELAAIYVLPEAQGQGHGRALFQRLLEECRRSGVETLSVAVHRDNWPSRRWYERRGFIYDHDTVAWNNIPEAVYRLKVQVEG